MTGIAQTCLFAATPGLRADYRYHQRSLPFEGRGDQSDPADEAYVLVEPAQTMAHLVLNMLVVRSLSMTDTIETLQTRMDAAARALDFEEAKRCRDMISLMRSGATAADAERADLSGIERPQTGAMGLGTSRQRVTPPSGWKPPEKPDLMTSGKTNRRGRQRE
jgi:hypothetical protein